MSSGGEATIGAMREGDDTETWSRSEILARYARYANELGIVPRDLSPDWQGNGRWVAPVMHKVIQGIEAGDAACTRLGIEFLEESAKFFAGKTLKSNTARALRRTVLTEEQKERVRRRVFGLLRDGHIPHEYRQYARLLRRVGFDVKDIPPVDERNGYAVHFRKYFEEAAREAKRKAGG
jgi:hypothetical protein